MANRTKTGTTIEGDSSVGRRTNAHRQLIGYVGLVLPFVLIVITAFRSEGTSRTWRPLSSVSAYYYSGAVAAFVGLLVALALFLFTYGREENGKYRHDRAMAFIAGMAAIGVAFFPTKAAVGGRVEPWWTPATGVVHYISAVVLFSMFAIFSLWLFRKTADTVPTPDKRWRNRIYLACGLLIVGGIAWAGANGRAGRPIFLPESVALVAFAISWLVKGYAHRTILRAARAIPVAVRNLTSRSPD